MCACRTGTLMMRLTRPEGLPVPAAVRVPGLSPGCGTEVVKLPEVITEPGNPTDSISG